MVKRLESLVAGLVLGLGVACGPNGTDRPDSSDCYDSCNTQNDGGQDAGYVPDANEDFDAGCQTDCIPDSGYDAGIPDSLTPKIRLEKCIGDCFVDGSGDNQLELINPLRYEGNNPVYEIPVDQSFCLIDNGSTAPIGRTIVNYLLKPDQNGSVVFNKNRPAYLCMAYGSSGQSITSNIGLYEITDDQGNKARIEPNILVKED
jgi:hypothetical protein